VSQTLNDDDLTTPSRPRELVATFSRTSSSSNPVAQSKLITQDPKQRWAPAKRKGTNRTVQQNPKIRRARAAQVVAHRVGGWTYGEIAEELRISVDTVKRDIEFADENGLIEEFEQEVMQKLAPKALQVLVRHMEHGNPMNDSDLNAAKSVFNYMKTKSNQKATKELKARTAQDELNDYFAQINQDAVTAEIISPEEQPRGLLSSGEAQVLLGGDSARAPERVAPVAPRQDREGAWEDSRVHDPAPGSGTGPADDHRDDSFGVE
jgi:transposase